jgi:hypothetical protein
MASRHLGKPESTRVPTETSEAAHALLSEEGWTVHAFLAACLTVFVRKPRETLAFIAEGRPEGRRTGRPPRAGKPPEVASHKPAPKEPERVDPLPAAAPVEPELPPGTWRNAAGKLIRRG